ncbi:imp-specific 5'-nucleotidase [Anaeramoeba flamelloides]|uniref:Imp-specific 5'-nucleotidase n=1 Tax=Anaeramoeba flamelloides TaxID=1746091 RepID=A0AAV7YV75_9EUKA|nr:imp-specific 5'-nucleotidase [Anaeramoeba flamelloides]
MKQYDKFGSENFLNQDVALIIELQNNEITVAQKRFTLSYTRLGVFQIDMSEFYGTRFNQVNILYGWDLQLEGKMIVSNFRIVDSDGDGHYVELKKPIPIYIYLKSQQILGYFGVPRYPISKLNISKRDLDLFYVSDRKKFLELGFIDPRTRKVLKQFIDDINEEIPFPLEPWDNVLFYKSLAVIFSIKSYTQEEMDYLKKFFKLILDIRIKSERYYLHPLNQVIDILVHTSSLELFNTLREIEHLAGETNRNPYTLFNFLRELKYKKFPNLIEDLPEEAKSIINTVELHQKLSQSNKTNFIYSLADRYEIFRLNRLLYSTRDIWDIEERSFIELIGQRQLMLQELLSVIDLIQGRFTEDEASNLYLQKLWVRVRDEKYEDPSLFMSRNIVANGVSLLLYQQTKQLFSNVEFCSFSSGPRRSSGIVLVQVLNSKGSRQNPHAHSGVREQNFSLSNDTTFIFYDHLIRYLVQISDIKSENIILALKTDLLYKLRSKSDQLERKAYLIYLKYIKEHFEISLDDKETEKLWALVDKFPLEKILELEDRFSMKISYASKTFIPPDYYHLIKNKNQEKPSFDITLKGILLQLYKAKRGYLRDYNRNPFFCISPEKYNYEWGGEYTHVYKELVQKVARSEETGAIIFQDQGILPLWQKENVIDIELKLLNINSDQATRDYMFNSIYEEMGYIYVPPITSDIREKWSLRENFAELKLKAILKRRNGDQTIIDLSGGDTLLIDNSKLNYYEKIVSWRIHNNGDIPVQVFVPSNLENRYTEVMSTILEKINENAFKKKGGICFDFDDTLVKTGVTIEETHPLLVSFFKLLEQGIKVAIIAGGQIERIEKQFLESLIKYLRRIDKLEYLKNLSIYSGGGGENFYFDVKGNLNKNEKYTNDPVATDVLEKLLDAELRNKLGLKKKEQMLWKRYYKALGLEGTVYWLEKDAGDLKEGLELVYKSDAKAQINPYIAISHPYQAMIRYFPPDSYNMFSRNWGIHDVEKIIGKFLTKEIEILCKSSERVQKGLIEKIKVLGFNLNWKIPSYMGVGVINKKTSMNHFIKSNKLCIENIIYLGDDFTEWGNDRQILDLEKVTCVTIDEKRRTPFYKVIDGPVNLLKLFGGVEYTKRFIDLVSTVLERQKIIDQMEDII